MWGGGGTIPIADPRRWGGGGWGRNYSYRRSQEVGGGGGGGGDYSYRRPQEVGGELFLLQIPGGGWGEEGTIPIADPRSGGKRELFLPLYMVTTMLILALMGNGVNHSNVPLTAALVEQSHNQAAPMNHDCALSLLPFHFSQVTN